MKSLYRPMLWFWMLVIGIYFPINLFMPRFQKFLFNNKTARHTLANRLFSIY
jgi:hypothetical protein